MSYEPDPSIYEAAVETWGDLWHPRVRVRHGRPDVFESMNYGMSPEHRVPVNRRIEPGERKATVYNRGTDKERRVIFMSPEEGEEVCTELAEGIIADMIEAGPQEFEIIVSETRARRVRVSAFSGYEAEAIVAQMVDDGAIGMADDSATTVGISTHRGPGWPAAANKDAWDSIAEGPADDFTSAQGDVVVEA